MNRVLGPTGLVLAVTAWAAGCGTPHPMVEPAFAARAYTPARVALLPPDVFMVYDQYGDNDPQKSYALGVQVANQTARLVTDALRQRGYDVDFSATRDGVRGADGNYLVTGPELGWLVDSILRFSNSPAGAEQGQAKTPAFVSPELAAKVGWATNADSLLYLNIKGSVVSKGKRTAQVLGVVFFVVIVAAIVALVIAESGGGHSRGGGHSPSLPAGGAPPQAVRAAPVTGWSSGAARAAPGPAPTQAIAAPRGYGQAPVRSGGHVYGGPRVSLGVGVIVPLDGPVHTHEGQVADQEAYFAGDQLYVSMTLVGAQDGRVLWHLRDDFDVAADKPQDMQRFVQRVFDTLPPSLGGPRGH